MLSNVEISNFILIEDERIELNKGFTVITGETGSGKSSLLSAISFLLGDRFAVDCIRKGAEKCQVTACFDIRSKELAEFVQSAGIPIDTDEEWILSRELLQNGKSRSFINQKSVTLSFLKEVGEKLVKRISQHSVVALRSRSSLRNYIDQFGRLQNELVAYQELWKEVRDRKSELEQMEEDQKKADFEIHQAKRIIEEIDEVAPKVDEEEKLNTTYNQLIHRKERMELASSMQLLLSDERGGVLTNLRKLELLFEKLQKIDPSGQESQSIVRASFLDLKEVEHFIDKLSSETEENASLLDEIDARLKKIYRIKRAYGPELSDVISLYEETKRKLSTFESLDEQVEEKRKDLVAKENELTKRANHLTMIRKEQAKKLEVKLQEVLRELNLPHALVRIEISKEERSPHGEDLVEYYFRLNRGENESALSTSLSGGELSRVLFAIYTLFADADNVETLLFDEIDSSIGGLTAKVFGEKLAWMGKKQQVIAVTHFPQVATTADLHLQVVKEEVEGRTRTAVISLSALDREKELMRMVGTK